MTPVKVYFKDLVLYLKYAGRGWWLILAAIFGFYDQIEKIAGALSPTLRAAMPSDPGWLPEVIMVAALLAGPFVAFRKLLRRLELMEKKLALSESRYREAFMNETLEMFYSEKSRKTTAQKFEELRAMYEPRRDEIRRGDFSRASELIPIIRYYAPLGGLICPTESIAYQMMQEEFKEIFDKVEGYYSAMRESAASPDI